MIITATEFKNKVGTYLVKAQEEDIIISKNGKYLARLTSIKDYEFPVTNSLTGVFEKAASYDLASAREERRKKYEDND